jgi:hypothetical protein
MVCWSFRKNRFGVYFSIRPGQPLMIKYIASTTVHNPFVEMGAS